MNRRVLDFLLPQLRTSLIRRRNVPDGVIRRWRVSKVAKKPLHVNNIGPSSEFHADPHRVTYRPKTGPCMKFQGTFVVTVANGRHDLTVPQLLASSDDFLQQRQADSMTLPVAIDVDRRLDGKFVSGARVVRARIAVADNRISRLRHPPGKPPRTNVFHAPSKLVRRRKTLVRGGFPGGWRRREIRLS